jgi:hypothetical protein
MIEATSRYLRNGMAVEQLRRNLVLYSRAKKDTLLINKTFIDSSVEEPEPDDQLMHEQYPKIREINKIE